METGRALEQAPKERRVLVANDEPEVEVSDQQAVAQLRAEYQAGVASQRRFG
jgi:hypothetical protein